MTIEQNPENELLNKSENDTIPSKEEKNKKEAEELIRRVFSNEIHDLRDRVAYILSSSANARNSDIRLAWQYWKIFESEIIGDGNLSETAMLKLTKLSSLARVRAKIQNEYKLFQADEAVKKWRGTLEAKMRDDAVEDKPNNLGLYSVYVDESGKNQKYLIVGSLWLLRYGPDYIRKDFEFKDWKKASNINYEFHFTEMRPTSLQAYKNFFLKFLTLYPEVGFKLIVVKNSGFEDQASALTDLTFHLINDGIEHENSSGRAPLPRKLDVIIDDEELGSDDLKLANVKERLKTQNIKGLHLGEFYAVPSNKNLFIQAIDLVVAAVNRKLNTSGDNKPKDQLADFVLNMINLKLEGPKYDKSTVFELSDFKLNT